MIKIINAYEYNGKIFSSLEEAEKNDIAGNIDLLFFDRYMQPQSIEDITQVGLDYTRYCYIGNMFSLEYLQEIFSYKDLPFNTIGYWYYDYATCEWYEYIRQIQDLKQSLKKFKKAIEEELEI